MSITTFADYAEQARTTATYQGRATPTGLTYAALALAGEASELLGALLDLDITDDRDTILDEAGDVAWYVVASCDEHGLDPAALNDNAEGKREPGDPGTPLYVAQRLTVWAGLHADTIKKAIGTGALTPPLQGTLRVNAISRLTHTQARLLDLAATLGVNPIDIYQRNIDKLADRAQQGTLLQREDA